MTRQQALIVALACLPGWAQATGCTMTPSALSFGPYDTIAPGANDSSATLQVVCIPGVSDPLTTAYTITIAGTGTGGDTTRSISFGSHRLYYQVHKDAGRATVWGNGGSSGTGVSDSVTSSAVLVAGTRTHTVYARMAARQAVAPGGYAGTLLVTINY